MILHVEFPTETHTAITMWAIGLDELPLGKIGPIAIRLKSALNCNRPFPLPVNQPGVRWRRIYKPAATKLRNIRGLGWDGF